MKSLILLISLTLIGCACKPTIQTRDQIVEKIVTVPCRTEAIPEPSWTSNPLTSNDDIHTQTQLLLAEIVQREQYEIKLKAAIKTCNDN